MDFETVEDKIVETVKAGIPYLRTVLTYAGDIKKDIAGFSMPLPAVLVSYVRSDFESSGDPDFEETVVFEILAVSRNLKGPEALRKGAESSYAILKDVLLCLANQDMGLQIERLRPKKVALITADKSTAVYAVTFKTAFDGRYEWQ